MCSCKKARLKFSILDNKLEPKMFIHAVVLRQQKNSGLMYLHKYWMMHFEKLLGLKSNIPGV